METSQGSHWGPPALPQFLSAQLQRDGFAPGDAAAIAQRMAGSNTSPSLFIDLGACKFLEGDIDGAVAAWRHAIASGDDHAAAAGLVNLGLTYERLQLYGPAISVLNSAGERDPDRALMATIASARCEHAAGLHDEATETMARLAQSLMAAEADEAELAEVLYGLGDVAFSAGRIDRAERAWRVASAGPSSPTQAAAMSRLVELYVQQGHDDQLVELVARLDVGALNDHAPAVLGRAELLARQGNRHDAGTLLNALVGQDLTAGERFRLADVRLQAGLVNEAIDELEALLADESVEMQQRAAFALAEVYRSYGMAEAASAMYDRVVMQNDPYWTPKAEMAVIDLSTPRTAADTTASETRQGEHAGVDVLGEPQVVALDELASAEQAVVEAAAPAVAEPEPVAPPKPDPTIVVLSELQDEEHVASSSLAGEFDQIVDDAASGGDMVEVDVVSAEVEVVALDDVPSELTSDRDDHVPEATASNAAEPASFSESLSKGLNPYASLAPERQDSDVAPTKRNPYAELAPNFSESVVDTARDEWDALLDDASADDELFEDEPVVDKTPTASAFSRYTS